MRLPIFHFAVLINAVASFHRCIVPERFANVFVNPSKDSNKLFANNINIVNEIRLNNLKAYFKDYQFPTQNITEGLYICKLFMTLTH